MPPLLSQEIRQHLGQATMKASGQGEESKSKVRDLDVTRYIFLLSVFFTKVYLQLDYMYGMDSTEWPKARHATTTQSRLPLPQRNSTRWTQHVPCIQVLCK